jgi:hypothetical protein
MFQDLLLFNVADGDTRRFLEEFDRLTAWVDNSLDMYKVSQLDDGLRGSEYMHVLHVGVLHLPRQTPQRS